MIAASASSSSRAASRTRRGATEMSRSCTVCAARAVTDELVHDAEPAADRDGAAVRRPRRRG